MRMPMDNNRHLSGLLFFIVMLALCMCSCRSTKEVEQNYQKSTDTIYISKTKIDSFYLRDSIYMKEYLQGDTVYQYKYVQKLQYRDKYIYDTIYQNKVDSVYIYKYKEVVKSQSLWDKIRTSLVGACVIALIAAIAYVIIKLYKFF